ncbi:MAG: hypothetical protein HYX73_10845 [Acidobacteria bacterium]|nr:hypothetical protein [Acidobacteriota bacterium]
MDNSLEDFLLDDNLFGRLREEELKLISQATEQSFQAPPRSKEQLIRHIADLWIARLDIRAKLLLEKIKDRETIE